jgi:uncharacterized surface protein with fasciclin (FAS1) repeats
MFFTTRKTTAGFAAAAALATLSLGACSSSGSKAASSAPAGSSAAAATAAASSAASTMGSDPGMGSTPFGPGCSAVPSSGAGSFEGMATAPVATAASNNPVLSTLVSAVKAAGLVDTLNSAQNITVFAPSNDAFAKIPAATLNSVMNDKAKLTSILTYHVVSGKLSPDQLAGTHKTLEGSDLTVTGSGESFKVNGANVICGNVQTANATVYIIDGVLMPPAS